MTSETSPPTSANYAAHVAAAYRALGHYVYRFSQLIFWMKVLGQRAGQDNGVLGFALGEASASTVNNWFFGIHFHFGGLDETETAVGKKLRAMVVEHIEFRNNILHGDWMIGYGNDEGIADPRFMRMKPGSMRSPLTNTAVPPADLEVKADQLKELTAWVIEFTNWTHLPNSVAQFGEMRASDLFTITDGAVRRNGPRAANSTGPQL